MTWSIDRAHTRLGFAVRHMMISTVRGEFQEYSGTVELNPDDFTQSRFEGEVEVASITTRNEQRDNHLRTNDFFDVPNHPKLSFKSTAIERKGDDYVVKGDLTIRGTTKEVAFDVEFAGAVVGFGGKRSAGFSATATINRRDFGVNFGAVLEAGGLVVADKVKLELEVEVVEDAA